MPDKAALLTAVLLDRAVCAKCISTKTGLTHVDVQATFAVIARVLTLHHYDERRCHLCGDIGPVFTLERLGN